MVERLQLVDVEHIPSDELVPLITRSFDNLVTVSIAEATNGYIPQKTRRLLRKAEWRLDWQDALLCACGELQVACERMRYTNDPRLQRTEYRLRRVYATAVTRLEYLPRSYAATTSTTARKGRTAQAPTAPHRVG
ncbi:hypothetical protein ABZ654_06055 [Streptomyces hygroscopicus]|uniref:hypothetical protein n=1 Tax=Streptomyces hygroscopicus TaxID=1912 RepID=UPI0033F81A09